MRLTSVIPLVVTFLFQGCVSGESCVTDSDCTGYNEYDGRWCYNGLCDCDQGHACKGYDQMASCVTAEDCAGYPVYTGIWCHPSDRCKCVKGSACTQICTDILCESSHSQYTECSIDEWQTIVRVTVTHKHSSSACDYSPVNVDAGYSGGGIHGYSDNILWVHGGCRANFAVCYQSPAPIPIKVKRDTGDSTIVCEGETTTISCSEPLTSIDITFASYGRTSTEICVHKSKPHSNTSCPGIVTEVVKGSCDGQVSCELEASNSVFGETCSGTYKYLKVTFECESDEVSSTSPSTQSTTTTTTTQLTTTQVTTSTPQPTSSTPQPTSSTPQPSSSTPQPTSSTNQQTSPTTQSASTTPEADDCTLNIQCPGSCSNILNPQEEVTLTMDVGCATEISLIQFKGKECPIKGAYLACVENEDTDIFMGNSVKYKPEESDLIWNYHGLFVTVYLVTLVQLTGNVIVEYGPIPVAGSCTIAPETGYALTTQYNLTCTGFSISGGHQLKYSLYTHHQEDYSKAAKVFTGTDSNRYNMLLQPGQVANNFTVFLWVKAFVSYGAYVKANLQTQVYPPSYAGDVSIVDLAESFVTVEDGQGSSLIEDLITGGNTDEASQLLGVITASLNLAIDNETKSDADNSKRQNVRTAIVSVLTEIPVTDIDSVSSTISILNGATEVTEEVSQEAQDVATDLYSNLADGFDQFIGQQSASEAIDTAGSILTGVTRILDLNTDSGMSHVNQTTASEASAAPTTAKVEKARNSTVKLLKTIDTVSSTMMVQQPTGGNTTRFITDTMTIGIQKLSRHGLSAASYSATGAANSTGNFVFPNIANKLASGQDYGVKMLYMKKNPYVWSGSSQDVTSPVMSVSLNGGNNTAVSVGNLSDPVAISLTNFGPEASSVHTFQVALQKTEGNTTDNLYNTGNLTGNITFAASVPNMLSFNVSAVADRTISINVAPVNNITSFKMLIKADRKPSFDEIVNEGFLYPEELQHSQFANFKYLQNVYTPAGPDAERTIYLTEDSPFLSSSNFSGTYYIGLTLDLNHTQTLEMLGKDYRECLGSEVAGCSEVVKVAIDIQTKQLGCIYWVEANETWSSDGCEVSPYTTRDKIECLCSHLTSFSGSILVMPNMVDPFDVSLFLTFFDNPVVVTAVIIVWIIYFFLIHWAKQADKKDSEKVGVINCLDNSPTENYIYLVCVVTGWWRDAGTTANVFIFLKGIKGSSSTHCLSTTARPCFQTGSEDWFLVTSEHSLGELREVTLWHDNMGASPAWYLNHVYVKDIQLRKSWHFIYNDWLAVNRGTLLQTSATLEAVTEEQLKFKQKHNFVVKSTQDLRDGHLWISIFSKPAKSTFTRVQRLTCALSLLLTTMLTNIMFYGIPTDDPDDQVGEAGGISISLSAIIIGIESSLIMFPINLLILQLFLKVKQRPRIGEREMSSKTYKYLATMYDTGSKLTDLVIGSMMEKLTSKMADFDQQNSEQDFDSVDSADKNSDPSLTNDTDSPSNRSFNTAKSNPSTISMKSSSSLDSVKTKSSKILPWWFLYIAWVLVITTCLICSYFVMLYGLKYGYNRSLSWLVSFLTGFTQSAFVTQPLKVIGIAVVITLIFKKPAEFDDFGPDVELDEDEIYLHEVVGAEEIHHPTVQPLSKRLLQNIRDRLYVEWLMDMTIRDIVLYAIYLGVVTFLVHGHRNINLAYRNNLAIEDVVVNPGCINLNKCFFLAKADKVETMYQYFEDVLFPSLADMSIADHGYATPGSSHFLLGPFRLRQQRIETGTCKSTHSSLSARFGQTMPECKGDYWLGDEDTGPYNNSWTKPLAEPLTDDGSGHWSHKSMWKLKTVPYGGIHATYSGGGYVLEFPQSADWTSILNGVKNTDWIDSRTRAIFAEFNLYNPNADLFSVVMIFFEFTNMGGVFPNHQIFTAKLYHYSSSIGSYVATCEFLFLLFNIAFTYIEVKRYKKLGKKQYFEDIWSIGEVIQLALSYTVIGLFFQRMLSVNDIMYDFRMSDGQTFVSFYTAIAWDFILGYVMAFQLAFVTLKSVKLLRFNKRMFMISDTVTFAKSNLISFAFMFVIFMIAFGHFTSQAFGTILYGYKSFGSSIFTMLNFALGASDLPGMYAANRILGPVFFAVFVFFSQWCFLTIFVAILNFGINDSKAKSEERRNKFELIDYVLGKVKSVF